MIFCALGALAIPYPLLLGNGLDIVQLAATGGISLGLLVILLALKPLATAACLGSGSPGGLFTPTLTVGVLLAASTGNVWSHLWPRPPNASPTRRSDQRRSERRAFSSPRRRGSLQTPMNKKHPVTAYAKREDMLVHENDPYNAEPPRSALAASAITPLDTFYVRGHGAVARSTACLWGLTVSDLTLP
jgi:hypothetical protein